ncbi:MAG: hypothetical protein AB7I33_05225 [Gemmatimonadales bacterium]
MRLIRTGAVAAALALGLTVPAQAQFTLEMFLGNSYSIPTRLTIDQAGFDPISFTAHYSTRPLQDTWYYAFRMGFWGQNRKGWVVDFVHHKLYLDNPPPEVQDFRVTYGFNLVTLGRAWRLGNFVLSASAGPVVTHESSRVRGRPYTATGGAIGYGYRIAGGTVVGGAQYRIHLVEGVFASLDTRVSASYANIRVAGGDAHVPNAALHLHGGIGYEF